MPQNPMPQNSKVLIGAIIAAVLAFAVYYGLISPQTASTIQSTANQSLGTAPASQQPASPAAQTTPAPQGSPAPAPAPAAPAPQSTP